MMENELPEGWTKTTIGEINSRKSKAVDPGLTPEKTFELYSVPIFDSGLPEIVKGSEIKSSKQIVSEDEVLVCKINPRINRVWKVGNFTDYQKIASSEWIVVNSNGIINPDFLRYQFQAPFFRSILQSEVSGVGGSLTRARPKLVDDYDIYLAPLAEQIRIVAKLDAAFGHLETMKTSLARIPELLKKFRQTVLTQAVTGKLTEGWREGKELGNTSELLNNLKLIRESLIKTRKVRDVSINPHDRLNNFLNLPENWLTTDLLNLSNIIDPNPTHRMPTYVSEGSPFISTENIVNENKIDFSIGKKVTIETVEDQIRRFEIKSGDFLFTRIGTIGRVCNLPIERHYALSHAVCVISSYSGELCLPAYLKVALKSQKVLQQGIEGVKSVGVPDLGMGKVRAFQIPLPSTEEQQEIVNRIEALFAQADALEMQYQSLKAKIDKLPQALLAKAFRGELVPQDPADEPASVLLEKIKSATAAVGKKGRKAGQTALAFMEE